jgi:hypothetical protein
MSNKEHIIVLPDERTRFEKIKEFFEDIWRYCRIRDWYYKIVARFWHKYYLIDTGLHRDQWIDTDTKMLYAMMKLLVDYIEGEKPFEHVDWEDDAFHKNAKEEMIQIYNWWKNYDTRMKEIQIALDNWYVSSGGNHKEFLDFCNSESSPETERLFDLHTKLEEALLKEEEDMMIRLVKIRGFLWT